MKRSAFFAALFCAWPAFGQDFQAPHITLSQVDWESAGNSLPSDLGATPAERFTALNATLSSRFPGIGKSAVPVLLPIDVAAFRKDKAANAPEASGSDRYFGDFSPSKLFLAGPSGYDASFWIYPKDAGLKFTYPKPVEVEIGGAAFIYRLDAPDNEQVFAPSKELADKFPGMKRILREGHVRFSFERFGVPYVISIQCYDRKPSRRFLTCRDADEVAERFLNRLQLAGGTRADITAPTIDLARPQKQSDEFSYYGPGDLIPNTGWKKMPGRADYTVYAPLRFPIANAPAYIKSQSFMPWGDCLRSGKVGKIGIKDSNYRCKVNDIPLVFNESAAVNFSYPWRDNFCELRDFHVGQCPGGYGHQAQDMRPSNCVLYNQGADRCLPYQHTVAAVHDGVIWRTPGNLGVFLMWNSATERVRANYLHMNPNMLDEDGVITGRVVSAGEIIGKVATWGDYEKGTSYHLHFGLQVFTRSGWVWVNPYSTLIASYERLLGERGREIKPGDMPPPTPDKPPVILNPSPATDASAKATPPAQVKKAAPAKKKRPPRKRGRRKHQDDET